MMKQDFFARFQIDQTDAEHFENRDLMIVAVTDQEAQTVGQACLETIDLLGKLASLASADGVDPEQRFIGVMWLIEDAARLHPELVKTMRVLDRAHRVTRTKPKEKMR